MGKTRSNALLVPTQAQLNDRWAISQGYMDWNHYLFFSNPIVTEDSISISQDLAAWLTDSTVSIPSATSDSTVSLASSCIDLTDDCVVVWDSDCQFICVQPLLRETLLNQALRAEARRFNALHREINAKLAGDAMEIGLVLPFMQDHLAPRGSTRAGP
jgi:hypothetical protein